MDRQQMIQLIKEQSGYSDDWKKSLYQMSDKQVQAIYFNLKRKGVIK